ncbi:hypothetical protein [Caulobacter sp. UNC358MFTsu5.1]|uniref:hypothetical protein n=1 Tax=Caulobacter sp. UNC358MFTsu5.1 TaxID=1449049 RepID=UPI00068CD6AB|nr:hypothetical protein [Caulobacter sp. UNC358MFTsu5.1]
MTSPVMKSYPGDLGFDAIGEASALTEDQDSVAARLARLEAHATAVRRVAVYHFIIPPGAEAASFNAPDRTRDAQDQLHLIVALTGGSIADRGGELRVRVPAGAANRFEALARGLIETFLVAFREDDPA